MVDISVVGAGVVGAAVAYRLAEAGARVTVVEAADHLGAGTSGRSFAWTNANDKPPRAYHDLNVAGMRAHAALRDEFGMLPWWHGGGSVDWFATDAERAAQPAVALRLRACVGAAGSLYRGRAKTKTGSRYPGRREDPNAEHQGRSGWQPASTAGTGVGVGSGVHGSARAGSPGRH